ncbi:MULTISPECIES: hypothetical protein [Bacillus cereus group]|uniref:Uncharacterized protein n=1 Tax=Bacillus cereus TaxID=1396 RepID=A0A1Q4L4D8_BACCE|nr:MULTISPECIES: hypothetical protein [Bacillus cereus group]EJP83474.1 hypothetical protein IAU_05454 [Bacillus cereus IS075]EOO82457.1 hypothetical protein IGS_05814 [Bacillus cereus IS845/00]EOO92540.1 hypothetical protein IGQ_05747 [Bacillus cereus IS195]MDX5927878.1 hypothetical protein [Bacillus cereus group sp. BfR-BA-00967]MDX5974989.1 hypothetical protein [Bacillus cereus group sp. BfR-BA-00287]
MGKNYSIDRDKKGRYRHSYVFMRGNNVEIKLFGHESLLKGKVTTIEEYYCVLDVEGDGNPYQVTVNFAEVKYIRHEEFVPVEERSPNYTLEDKKTSFVFALGEKIACAFKDGKRIKGLVISEGAYYLYIKTDKGNFCTIMKSALSYIAHGKHTPLLETNDFYTEEMKAAAYEKPTEYVFSVGVQITVFFANGKSVSGVVQDESKYWVLLQSEKLQITILKGSYSYFKHEVYEKKPYLYVANKRLKKTLRNDE